MTERKTVFRWSWVWDYDKEEAWLNSMAEAGWTLCSIRFALFYTFEKTEPGKYIIRLEMHPYDEGYMAFMSETGAELVARVMQWSYYKRDTKYGEFKIFSDIDSMISHLEKIEKTLYVVGFCNLSIGIANSINVVHIGWINLLTACLIFYGLGRIHGKKDELKKERDIHE